MGAAPSALRVVGNMKYDRVKTPAKDPEISALIAALGWGQDPIWVAGSTHPVEEDILLAAFKLARERFLLRLVLAPRHPERAPQAAQTLKDAGTAYRTWSQEPGKADCLTARRLGVLPRFYGYASVSFVGGTLVPVGGHNLLEPAIAGSPVLFGPRTERTAEVARLLMSAGCRICVEDAQTLASALCDLLADPDRRLALGRQAYKISRGAARRD